MTEFVRVVENGTHKSMPVSHVEAVLRDHPGALEILDDHDAVDADGHPLPPKYRTTVEASKPRRAPESKPRAPQPDDTPKESA